MDAKDQPWFVNTTPLKSHLDDFVFTGLIALVQVAVLVFAGNGDPSGAVQLLQLAETALLLDDAGIKEGEGERILSQPP